jgi:GR25 family glycosyltransferase involved in LPS biosynthesis
MKKKQYKNYWLFYKNMDLINEKCEFYCLCYNNPVRYKSMKERFGKVGLDLNVFEGVDISDPRIANQPIDIGQKRLWSITYGHIEMLRLFLNTDKKYGFFCEDDIYLRKDFADELPNIMNEFEIMNLDFLLLGHMTNFKIEWWMSQYPLKVIMDERPYRYHSYPDMHWGAHLYMVTRKHAQALIDKFGNGYADATLTDSSIPSFSPDWTVTKQGNRALMYPMMAIEDSIGDYGHAGQTEYHKSSTRLNYDPELFV